MQSGLKKKYCALLSSSSCVFLLCSLNTFSIFEFGVAHASLFFFFLRELVCSALALSSSAVGDDLVTIYNLGSRVLGHPAPRPGRSARSVKHRATAAS